jgi:hypothetical protein
MRKLGIVACLAMLLAACGGGGATLSTAGGGSSSSSSSGGSGSSSSGGQSVTAHALTAVSNSATVATDGSTTATITVYASNTANDLISGVNVAFSANNGGLVQITQPVTTAAGIATAVLTAPNAVPGSVITVTATGGGQTATVLVQVIATSSGTTSVTAAHLTATTSSTTVASDGSTSATITVTATNASNVLIPGVIVSFSASTGGELQLVNGTTNASGAATVVLTAPNAAVPTITVNATGGGQTATPVTVQVVAPTSTGPTTTDPKGLSISSNVQSIPADGSSSATITAIATNAKNNVLSGVPICFNLTSASVTTVAIAPANPNGNGCAVTGSDGRATATLTAIPGSAIAGTSAVLQATGGTATTITTQPITLQIVSTQTGTTTTVSALQLSASPSTIYTDGSVTSTITALALDASNNVLSGVPVTFTTTSDDAANPVAGALAVSQPSVTGPNGTLTAVLSTGGNTDLRNITVSATAGKLAATSVQVGVKANIAPPSPKYALGNGSAGQFVPSVISAGTTTLSAGGSTSLALTVVTLNSSPVNALYNANPVTVTFNSTCLASGQAQILPAGSLTPSLSITTTTGSIGATYTAKGCSVAGQPVAQDVVTATATVGGQIINATTTLSIAAATIGQVKFISASPPSIGLKGTGLNETSTVTFQVTDSTGGAESGVNVNFSLDTSVGGLSLGQLTATSGTDGNVRTTVQAGTVHTTVRVTATVPAVTTGPNTSPQLSTESSGLTVTTGLPASDTFSIAVGKASNAPSGTNACPNVEAFDINLVTVPITVQLADRYKNPAPDGTSVAFHTNGGSVGGSCTTPLSYAGDGACSVLWTSANPRPGIDPTINSYPQDVNLTYGYPAGYTPLRAAGRAVILATTIGEESFTDLNGSGFYQAGDPFQKLGDPYEADNEQSVYQSGDYFLNYYQTPKYVDPATANNGQFQGITCTGVTPADSCSTKALAIGATHLVIMSTSKANISLVSSTGFQPGSSGLLIGSGGTGTITINVQDTNGNAMAAGTVVAWSFSNTNIGATLSALPPTVVGCDSGLGGEDFAATLQTTAGDSGSGTAYVTVTSPSGTQTTEAVPITIVPAPTVSLTANPNTITAGNSTVLKWTTVNATSCQVPAWDTSGATTEPTTNSTGITVSPSATTTYTLSCTGLGGQGVGSALVTVN